MPIYKDDFLKTVFNDVKKGAKLKDVMARYQCDKRAAIDIYDQAAKLYGRGPKKEKRIPRQYIPPKREEKKIERPVSQYSNSGYFETVNKYG